MRTARRSSSAYDGLSSALRAFVARRAQELIGLCLLALAGTIAASLATWSVDDPSLNNATDAAIRNVLGWPGAIVADLFMQLLGLGSIAALLPLALWGWRLMKSGHLGRGQLRFALWILGAGAATALASALPATDRWPLPTGLGGVVGDAILAGAKAVTGLSSGSASAILGFVFAGIAILALSAACGLGLSEGRHREELDDFDEPVEPKRGRKKAAEWEDQEEPGQDEPGWGIVSLGALAHGVMSLRSAARRWSERRADAEDDLEPAMAGGATRRGAPEAIWTRREPILDDAPGRARPAPASAPLHDEDEEGWEDDIAPPPAGSRVSMPEAAPSRVAPVPAAPKPGKRMVREAQPSFLDEGNYQLPALNLLAEPKKPSTPTVSADALEQNANLLEGTLEDFGVKGEIINVRPGPVVTLYELEPAPGTKSSRVISLADDIARSMSAVSARVAVVQGRNAIGIELPNHKRETVFLRELLASQDFESTKQKLALCLGKTIGGEPVIADLARMPHLLVAGTTGSGKSVAINTMILSLVYRLKPEECRLIMVDPKMLELSVYDGIPHLLTPVVTDPKKAVVALKWAVREMEDRYKKMSKLGVRNIDGFNARVSEAKAKGEVITRTVQTGFDRET
ncbi:DNA translocase FtsK 4TM domain-containing protein, partial [Microvirga sp. 2TAF3]|uniref:DNA translocase FtsK n=1 Tax=Microvirga sp. 2TAF3 TaxID=3233014 RepID=UPI003F9E739C